VGLKQSRVVPRDRKKKKNPLPNNNISLPHCLPLTPSTLLHTGTVKLIKFSSIFDLLSVVFIFFVIDLMVSIDFVLRTCAQITVVKV